MPATASRQDVICADILDPDRPRTARTLRRVPRNCNRKAEAPKAHPMSFVPISEDFCTARFAGGLRCERG